MYQVIEEYFLSRRQHCASFSVLLSLAFGRRWDIVLLTWHDIVIVITNESPLGKLQHRKNKRRSSCDITLSFSPCPLTTRLFLSVKHGCRSNTVRYSGSGNQCHTTAAHQCTCRDFWSSNSFIFLGLPSEILGTSSRSWRQCRNGKAKFQMPVRCDTAFLRHLDATNQCCERNSHRSAKTANVRSIWTERNAV